MTVNTLFPCAAFLLALLLQLQHDLQTSVIHSNHIVFVSAVTSSPEAMRKAKENQARRRARLLAESVETDSTSAQELGSVQADGSAARAEQLSWLESMNQHFFGGQEPSNSASKSSDVKRKKAKKSGDKKKATEKKSHKKKKVFKPKHAITTKDRESALEAERQQDIASRKKLPNLAIFDWDGTIVPTLKDDGSTDTTDMKVYENHLKAVERNLTHFVDLFKKYKDNTCFVILTRGSSANVKSMNGMLDDAFRRSNTDQDIPERTDSPEDTEFRQPSHFSDDELEFRNPHGFQLRFEAINFIEDDRRTFVTRNLETGAEERRKVPLPFHPMAACTFSQRDTNTKKEGWKIPVIGVADWNNLNELAPYGSPGMQYVGKSEEFVFRHRIFGGENTEHMQIDNKFELFKQLFGTEIQELGAKVYDSEQYDGVDFERLTGKKFVDGEPIWEKIFIVGDRDDDEIGAAAAVASEYLTHNGFDELEKTELPAIDFNTVDFNALKPNLVDSTWVPSVVSRPPQLINLSQFYSNLENESRRRSADLANLCQRGGVGWVGEALVRDFGLGAEKMKKKKRDISASPIGPALEAECDRIRKDEMFLVTQRKAGASDVEVNRLYREMGMTQEYGPRMQKELFFREFHVIAFPYYWNEKELESWEYARNEDFAGVFKKQPFHREVTKEKIFRPSNIIQNFVQITKSYFDVAMANNTHLLKNFDALDGKRTKIATHYDIRQFPQHSIQRDNFFNNNEDSKIANAKPTHSSVLKAPSKLSAPVSSLLKKPGKSILKTSRNYKSVDKSSASEGSGAGNLRGFAHLASCMEVDEEYLKEPESSEEDDEEEDDDDDDESESDKSDESDKPPSASVVAMRKAKAKAKARKKGAAGKGASKSASKKSKSKSKSAKSKKSTTVSALPIEKETSDLTQEISDKGAHPNSPGIFFFRPALVHQRLPVGWRSAVEKTSDRKRSRVVYRKYTNGQWHEQTYPPANTGYAWDKGHTLKRFFPRGDRFLQRKSRERADEKTNIFDSSSDDSSSDEGESIFGTTTCWEADDEINFFPEGTRMSQKEKKEEEEEETSFFAAETNSARPSGSKKKSLKCSSGTTKRGKKRSAAESEESTNKRGSKAARRK